MLDFVKRNRTLPNNETMGPLLMKRIEEFSLCLADNFEEDECGNPFTPPFITRVFELHFVKAPLRSGEGQDGKKGSPTLTWKLGQKVDHWRPADDVLDAWREAAGRDSGLEISFVE